MFKPKIDIENLDALTDHLDFVEKMLNMKTDVKFQEFIKEKVLDLADLVTNEKLVGGTTNDDAIDLYKSSHQIRDFEEGFILYNDAKIDANVAGSQNNIQNYPNGQFCVALAFEYGVGLVGERTASENAWAYNLNGYYFGWFLPKEVAQANGIPTWQEYGGYEGFEIYRNIADRVTTNLPKWVKEYYKKEVK